MLSKGIKEKDVNVKLRQMKTMCLNKDCFSNTGLSWNKHKKDTEIFIEEIK